MILRSPDPYTDAKGRARLTITDLRFIDDNSRIEKITGKRIRHALEDIVGLKQATFQRLANTARRDFLLEKYF